MKKKFQNLRLRYLMFVAVVVLTTVVTQAVIHWYLSHEVDDAGLINLATRHDLNPFKISIKVLLRNLLLRI